jgi:CRISPR-associated protein Cas2
MNRLWVIAYDIEGDATRRLVHDILKDHGQRVQFSVFECWLGIDAVQTLRERIRDELGDGDRVRWYPLCQWCRKTVQWQGEGDRVQDEGYYLV